MHPATPRCPTSDRHSSQRFGCHDRRDLGRRGNVISGNCTRRRRHRRVVPGRRQPDRHRHDRGQPRAESRNWCLSRLASAVGIRSGLGGGNIIAFNDGPALRPPRVSPGARSGINAIFGNGGPGIDLNDDGVTPNTPDGANNTPVLISADGWDHLRHDSTLRPIAPTSSTSTRTHPSDASRHAAPGSRLPRHRRP